MAKWLDDVMKAQSEFKCCGECPREDDYSMNMGGLAYSGVTCAKCGKKWMTIHEENCTVMSGEDFWKKYNR